MVIDYAKQASTSKAETPYDIRGCPLSDGLTLQARVKTVPSHLRSIATVERHYTGPGGKHDCSDDGNRTMRRKIILNSKMNERHP